MDLAVGTTIEASASEPATYDSAGFAALSFTPIGDVESIGEFGGSAEVSTFVPLDTGTVKKKKGSIDYGTINLSIGRLDGDAGQDLLKAGFDGAQRNTVHSFKVTNNDGTIAYFTGLITSFTRQVNDANAVFRVMCNVELDNSVVEA